MLIFIGGTPTGTLKHISVREYRDHCGMLTSWADGSHPRAAIKLGAAWAMDNFAFTNFDAGKFRASLKKWQGLPGCKFCVAPDVWGNARATASLFAEWAEEIRAHGYPVALAAQDGLEDVAFDWRAIDALFVGGTNEFKGSQFVSELVMEARLLGKWTHMGRVNSASRWTYCLNLGFDSVDGSGLAIERRRIKEALVVLRNRQTPMFRLVPNL